MILLLIDTFVKHKCCFYVISAKYDGYTLGRFRLESNWAQNV